MDEGELPIDEGVGSDRVRSAVLHQLPWYVIAYEGPEHRVVALNAAELRVLGGFNPIGMRLADFLIGSEGQGIIELFDRAYAGEQSLLYRTRMAVVTPQGHEDEIVVDFEVSPFRNRHDEIVGVVGVGRDVTEQVRREEEQAGAAGELSRRYRRATDVIEEVQRALLPSRLPVLPALDLAASYSVGGEEQAAGGDWFDVLPIGGDRVAAVVGDVVGHGVDASAVMAQLRAVTLERLHAGAGPAEVVAALDRFVEVVPAARGATICILTIDLDHGDFQYCSAGHPPPLLADRLGEGLFLDPTGEGPIGEATDRRAVPGRLELDQLLLLYTDGIIERPGVPATRGTVELSRTTAAAVADELFPAFSAPSAVDRATAQVLERLTRQTGATDDVTLLALQRVPALESFGVDGVVGLLDIADVRASLRAWFRPGQVDERALAELDQIVTELMENAVEHAYDGSNAPVAVRADLDQQGSLVLTVADRGQWRSSPQPNRERGIGLALVRNLATAMSIDHADGTSVTVRYRPWKGSHKTVPHPPAAETIVADVYLEQRSDEHVLRAKGPIDTATIAELDAQLALATAPRAPNLVIDLDDVTMLSSRAIGIIRASLRRAEDVGVHVRIRCRPGTVAQQVLSLAAIPVDSATGS